MLFFTFLLVATLLQNIDGYSAYYDRSTDSKIIGGQKVDIRKYPYQVGIRDIDGLACGGSILSKRHVLTVTPCVTDTSPPLTICAGTSFWAHSGSVHNIEHNITYGSKRNTDPAILRVVEPFVFDYTRQPVRLWAPRQDVKGGTKAVVTGWGVTKSGDWSNQLMSGQVSIVDRKTCNNLYAGKLNSGEICAGGFGHDACQGDSGGPLVINGRQVGIVSFGSGCGLLKYPSIYADVGYYNHWINIQISR